MKTLKKTDVWLQAIFIIVFTIVTLVKLDSTFIIGYFIAGGIQLFSMITHHVNGMFQNKRRKIYQFTSYILAATGCLTLLVPWLFLWLFKLYYAMLLIAPIMAIYYLYICYDETYHHMERPLAKLK